MIFLPVEPAGLKREKGDIMNKAFIRLAVIAACAAFGFGQGVQIRDQRAFFYAYLDCAGPFTQMQAKIGEFMPAYMGQGLGPFTGLMAVYFDAPGQVPEAELKWRIGAPIDKEKEPAAPLKKDIFDHPKVAYALHVGPYEKVGETYAKISAFIENNGWQVSGPALEIYLDNPAQTAPEKLRTEIMFPDTKK
jgi:AraC family transcriptional regulator